MKLLYPLIMLIFTNFLGANRLYSINLSFPWNDELNQVTIRKDFQLSDNFYLCSSIGLIMNPFNLGFKYKNNYNKNGFVFYSGIGYTPLLIKWGPGVFYHFSPSYQWKATEYLYFNLGLTYSLYYDFPEANIMEGFSGILPFYQLSIKF